MKLTTKAISACLALACVMGSLAAQEIRTLVINRDRDQEYMGSKVYELKHIKANDLTPFILGAVKRYNSQSNVQRLNYSAGKKQFLIVSTGVDMLPYVDDMIAKLDRPCAKLDGADSIVDGDGIYRFVYSPKYRADDVMRAALKYTISDGINYFDASKNTFYWKDSLSDGTNQLKWLKAIDRPVPQVELTLKVYEVNENDFKELGIDFISWKNGPGADLLGIGWDWTNFQSFTDAGNVNNGLNIISKGAGASASNLGGFMVAPQFDATFLRMLAQKGKAKSATSGSLRITNDFVTGDPGNNNFANAKFRLRFTPNYQIIQKDAEQNIAVNASELDYYFYLRTPTICFDDSGSQAGTLMFGWVLNIQNNAEQVNNGAVAVNQQVFRSWLTLACGTEKLIGSFEKDHKVNQETGIPFLCDIPILKYFVGSTVESKTKSRVFVTVSATPVKPEGNLSEWAGKIITAADMLKEDDTK